MRSSMLLVSSVLTVAACFTGSPSGQDGGNDSGYQAQYDGGLGDSSISQDAGGDSSDSASDGASLGGGITRTFAFHQLTVFPSEEPPRASLSADGSLIVFTNAIAAAGSRNHLFTIKPDGTGLSEIDSMPNSDTTWAEISPNGQQIIWGDGYELRSVSPSGSNKQTLLMVTGGKYQDFRFTGDSNKVIYVIPSDATALGSAAERGLWIMNANGSGKSQVIGPAAIAAAAGFGVTADQVSPYYTCSSASAHAAAASLDGARVTLAAYKPGVASWILAANGGSVRKLVETSGYTYDAYTTGLSSDGTKALYVMVLAGTQKAEVGVIGFDGTGRLPLTTTDTTFLGSSCAPVFLTPDGSKVYAAESGLVFAADGSSVMQLDSEGATRDGVMNGDATRFAFKTFDVTAGHYFLWGAEVNPVSLGGAPAISHVNLSATSVKVGVNSAITVSARITGQAAITRIHMRLMDGGRVDTGGPFDGALVDDGTGKDVTAGDGIFTGVLPVYSYAKAGARVVRIRAETVVGGLRHFTEVEVPGFSVVP